MTSVVMVPSPSRSPSEGCSSPSRVPPVGASAGVSAEGPSPGASSAGTSSPGSGSSPGSSASDGPSPTGSSEGLPALASGAASGEGTSVSQDVWDSCSESQESSRLEGVFRLIVCSEDVGGMWLLLNYTSASLPVSHDWWILGRLEVSRSVAPPCEAAHGQSHVSIRHALPAPQPRGRPCDWGTDRACGEGS